MATVVNIKPSDPWAGFGEAFAQSMAQRRELENKKALMDYQAELDIKKYSADAAILASIPATEQATAIAKKAQQDMVAKSTNEGIDQAITPGSQLMEQFFNVPGVGVLSPEGVELREEYPKTYESLISGGGQNLVKQTPGQLADLEKENNLTAQRAKIAVFKAEKAAQGQVVTTDPTTGEYIVTNAKAASDLSMSDVNKLRGKLEIDVMRKQLNKADREAQEAGEEYKLKGFRIADISKMIQEDSRFDPLFTNS
jgi:hypothetical protein